MGPLRTVAAEQMRGKRPEKGVDSAAHMAHMGRKRNFRSNETSYMRHLSSIALPNGTVSGLPLSVPFLY